MELPMVASLREPCAPARASSFGLRAGDEGAAHVIHLRGELDFVECPRLDRALADAEDSSASMVVLDCDELEFIDVAGLHLLIAASLRSRDNGDRLRITCSAIGVARLFRVSGLDAILPLVGSRRAA